MSRMTSAQVIALGEYLNPDFDPTALTISQLLGVFGFHNIKYPTPYTKAKLVELFNEEIKPKAAKFKRDKLKKERSIASDDGITDGLTGMPLSQPKPVRRSSRHMSVPKAPVEVETSPPKPDPPKRRRSSAQPSLGGPSSRSSKPSASRTQLMITEESEPEEELPVRKVGRSKKTSEAAGSQARRVSQITDDSGWEDNNIFQSGAESSSPLRPSPVKPRTRKTSATLQATKRKSRKAASEPPQPQLPQSLPYPDEFVTGVPQSKFEPDLPPDIRVTRGMRTSLIHQNHAAQVHTHNVVEPVKEEDRHDDLPEGGKHSQSGQEIIEVSSDSPDEGKEQERMVASIARRVKDGDVVVPFTPSYGSSNWFLRFLTSVLLFVALAVTYDYKSHSALIGFCDTGRDTNAVLEASRHYWTAVEVCNKENRTLLYSPGTQADDTPCPLLNPFPRPDNCTPCPKHATCSQRTVSCEAGYIVRPHPLLSFIPRPSTSTSTSWAFPDKWDADFSIDYIWQGIGLVVDGLPGFGPVAFPPRCVEDPKRKRHIGALGKAVESMLGQERGRRVCAGLQSTKNDKQMSEADEARIWGVDIDTLRDTMKRKTAPHLLETFNDTFNEAIQQLVEWGGVILGEDPDGKRYLAHTTPDLTWDCVVTVKARQIWTEYQRMAFSLIACFMAYLLDKSRRARRRIEDKRVTELVQVTLESLRNQELRHHIDPISTPQAFISSLQLRDLILQEEHSISTRNKLWDRVERIVEGNANVRTNMEEVPGGDEMRVWRWVGSASKT